MATKSTKPSIKTRLERLEYRQDVLMKRVNAQSESIGAHEVLIRELNKPKQNDSQLVMRVEGGAPQLRSYYPTLAGAEHLLKSMSPEVVAVLIAKIYRNLPKDFKRMIAQEIVTEYMQSS